MTKEKSWRVFMEEQRKLRKKGAALICQRIKLLQTIEKDQGFVAWCEDTGTNTYAVLDEELMDVGFDYLTLSKVLECFPSEESWQDRPLQKLVAEAVLQKKTRKRDTREAVSWKTKALELQKENERLRGLLEAADARIDELERVIGLVTTGKMPSDDNAVLAG